MKVARLRIEVFSIVPNFTLLILVLEISKDSRFAIQVSPSAIGEKIIEVRAVQSLTLMLLRFLHPARFMVVKELQLVISRVSRASSSREIDTSELQELIVSSETLQLLIFTLVRFPRPLSPLTSEIFWQAETYREVSLEQPVTSTSSRRFCSERFKLPRSEPVISRETRGVEGRAILPTLEFLMLISVILVKFERSSTMLGSPAVLVAFSRFTILSSEP